MATHSLGFCRLVSYAISLRACLERIVKGKTRLNARIRGPTSWITLKETLQSLPLDPVFFFQLQTSSFSISMFFNMLKYTFLNNSYI